MKPGAFVFLVHFTQARLTRAALFYHRKTNDSYLCNDYMAIVDDPLIEDIVKQVCKKTNLPVFIGSSGKYLTVLCCCKSFTEQMKKELNETLGEKVVKENFHFRTGHVEYL